MTSLNFGHRNVLQTRLRELLLQTEELRTLLMNEEDRLRMIPSVNVPMERQRERYLATLNKLDDAVHAMCATFRVEFDPVDVDHKVKSIAEYLKVTVKEVRPDHLRGYGVIEHQDQVMLNVHIERILSLLHELGEHS